MKDIINFPIVGSKYVEGGMMVPLMDMGTILTLKEEPDNPHDPHAIQVLVGEHCVGYVPNMGYTCSVCYSAVGSAEFCKNCNNSWENFIKGGLATRLILTGSLKKQYSAFIQEPYTVETKVAYVKLIIE